MVFLVTFPHPKESTNPTKADSQPLLASQAHRTGTVLNPLIKAFSIKMLNHSKYRKALGQPKSKLWQTERTHEAAEEVWAWRDGANPVVGGERSLHGFLLATPTLLPDISPRISVHGEMPGLIPDSPLTTKSTCGPEIIPGGLSPRQWKKNTAPGKRLRPGAGGRGSAGKHHAHPQSPLFPEQHRAQTIELPTPETDPPLMHGFVLPPHVSTCCGLCPI